MNTKTGEIATVVLILAVVLGFIEIFGKIYSFIVNGAKYGFLRKWK